MATLRASVLMPVVSKCSVILVEMLIVLGCVGLFRWTILMHTKRSRISMDHQYNMEQVLWTIRYQWIAKVITQTITGLRKSSGLSLEHGSNGLPMDYGLSFFTRISVEPP
jgi:hypothetical protein